MTSFVDEPAHLVQLRDSIRRFVEREMPCEAVRRWDRERTFPREVFHRLAATGEEVVLEIELALVGP